MDNEKITLKIKCRCCGKEHPVRLYLNDLEAWQNGDKLVQEAFPYLSPSKRELLLTRTCPECWDNMFGRY